MAVEIIITRVADRGVKIVMATHDIGEAKRIAGDVVFLVRGKLVEQTPSSQFFHHPEAGKQAAFSPVSSFSRSRQETMKCAFEPSP